MPNPISVAAWTFLAVFFVWDGWRRRRGLAREFSERRVRPRGVRLSLLIRVGVVPGAVVVQWVTPFPLSLVPLWILCDLYFLATYPKLMLRVTGGPDPTTANSREQDPRSVLRGIWDDLDELMRCDDGTTANKGLCFDRLDALIGKLPALKQGDTAQVASMLEAQAHVWVFPPDQWSVGIAQGEMELYQAALALWPKDHPARPATAMAPDALWELFTAYEDYAQMWRHEYGPDDLVRRESALGALRQCRRPESARFVDLTLALRKVETGEVGMGQEGVDALVKEIQQEMNRLFPSVKVFRGAVAVDDPRRLATL